MFRDHQMLSHSTDPFSSYFGRLRRDILAQVPKSTKHVLSVGCGAGLTEAELVRNGITVCGIEMNSDAAAMARKQGLDVFNGDVADASQWLSDREFDCVIYADVLEHIVDPVAIIRSHVGNLKTSGVAIISVPNFRHYNVFVQLFIQGRVTYADAGILDRTHVRITTRKLVEEWCRELGLELVSATYEMWRRERWLSALTCGMLREFLARQIIIVAQKTRGSGSAERAIS
jgi:methionine biosynthesis protein MetW